MDDDPGTGDAVSYRAGIGPALATALGMDYNDCGAPRIFCDDCRTARGVEKKNGEPYLWFLRGGSPPGWKTLEAGTEHRRDYCKRCRGMHA